MSVVLSGPFVATTETVTSVKGTSLTGRAPVGRILIAGDETSLAEIMTLVSTLDDRARGQVFIEVDSAYEIVGIDAPELVTVAWLTRSSRSGEPGTCESCRRGQALGRAVRAWVSEMHTGDPEVDGGELTAVILGSSVEVFDLRSDLIVRLGSTATGSATGSSAQSDSESLAA